MANLQRSSNLLWNLPLPVPLNEKELDALDHDHDIWQDIFVDADMVAEPWMTDPSVCKAMTAHLTLQHSKFCAVRKTENSHKFFGPSTWILLMCEAKTQDPYATQFAQPLGPEDFEDTHVPDPNWDLIFFDNPYKGAVGGLDVKEMVLSTDGLGPYQDNLEAVEEDAQPHVIMIMIMILKQVVHAPHDVKRQLEWDAQKVWLQLDVEEAKHLEEEIPFLQQLTGGELDYVHFHTIFSHVNIDNKVKHITMVKINLGKVHICTQDEHNAWIEQHAGYGGIHPGASIHLDKVLQKLMNMNMNKIQVFHYAKMNTPLHQHLGHLCKQHDEDSTHSELVKGKGVGASIRTVSDNDPTPQALAPGPATWKINEDLNTGWGSSREGKDWTSAIASDNVSHIHVFSSQTHASVSGVGASNSRTCCLGMPLRHASTLSTSHVSLGGSCGISEEDENMDADATQKVDDNPSAFAGSDTTCICMTATIAPTCTLAPSLVTPMKNMVTAFKHAIIDVFHSNLTIYKQLQSTNNACRKTKKSTLENTSHAPEIPMHKLMSKGNYKDILAKNMISANVADHLGLPKDCLVSTDLVKEQQALRHQEHAEAAAATAAAAAHNLTHATETDHDHEPDHVVFLPSPGHTVTCHFADVPTPEAPYPLGKHLCTMLVHFLNNEKIEHMGDHKLFLGKIASLYWSCDPSSWGIQLAQVIPNDHGV
ncbi:hypothetical protein DACRYDRAFT_18940 [Dacryopinax primogenitus]|uniref:Uncharacterized protein n=1 Tax=Dacryopinax primogenitus (strain DJM 731) TaxID=1858805 RepID=M5FPQ6_DACPD|nr:uncharacterized protein DACRYDRAFT_18940 [Dacryopinax primogenitus]EJT97243.1 hypothetical protein DACRYDRAFT_18940 [Dacryopinax primogenitus]